MKTRDFADIIRRRMAEDPALAAAVEKILAEEFAGRRKLAAPPRPCPCCGRKVGFPGGDPWEDWERGVGFCVECPKCNLSLWSFKGETPDVVVSRWNRRAAGVAPGKEGGA